MRKTSGKIAASETYVRSDEERVDVPRIALHQHCANVCAGEIKRCGGLGIAHGQRRIGRDSERCHENDILLSPVFIDEPERFVDRIMAIPVIAGADQCLRSSNPLEGLLTVSG